MITIQAGYSVVIDDEPANRDFLERLLLTAGFKVTGVGTGAEALKAAKAVPELALAVVDQELPDMMGLDLVRALRADHPESLIVMATMHDHRELIEQAFEAGIDVFLVKPHGFMELFRRLKDVDSDTSLLRALIIDQYGPRPYKGKRGTQTQNAAVVQAPSSASVKTQTVAAVQVPPQPDPSVQPQAAAVQTSTPPTAEKPKEIQAVEAKAEIQPEPKVEPKIEPKAEAKVEAKAESKAEIQPEPKIEPKIEPKTEPKVESKAESNADSADDATIVSKTQLKLAQTKPLVAKPAETVESKPADTKPADTKPTEAVSSVSVEAKPVEKTAQTPAPTAAPVAPTALPAQDTKPTANPLPQNK
jgi:DNA-binding response OmpR family regulator